MKDHAAVTGGIGLGPTARRTPGLRPAIAMPLSLTMALTGAALGEGGETPGSAVAINALPFNDTGDTSDGNVNDRNEVCPFVTDAPDVFYSITPDKNIEITIDLCESDYDTQVYVLDDNEVRIACNDDACVDENEDPTLRSILECVALEAGRTYFIGVDGGPGDPKIEDRGPYTIRVTECEPLPPWECPVGAAPEGEECVEGGVDTFNGGCNSEPPVFSPIACGDVICGNAWAVTQPTNRRDTDWYQIETTVNTRFTLRGSFNFDQGTIGFIFMAPGNEGSGDCQFVLGCQPCETGDKDEILSITTDMMPPGTHWFFVAPELGGIVACPGDPFDPNYWIELTCEEERPPCPSDVNGDGIVGFQDIVRILSDWGPCPE